MAVSLHPPFSSPQNLYSMDITSHTKIGRATRLLLLNQQNKRIQSLRDWCFDNGLTEVHEKLVKAGYTTCKMLSKCRDEQIEKIARDLEFTTPQELTFKVAVEELRTQYLENNYQLRHPEEHRSLTDIISKITESEQGVTMILWPLFILTILRYHSLSWLILSSLI